MSDVEWEKCPECGEAIRTFAAEPGGEAIGWECWRRRDGMAAKCSWWITFAGDRLLARTLEARVAELEKELGRRNDQARCYWLALRDISIKGAYNDRTDLVTLQKTEHLLRVIAIGALAEGKAIDPESGGVDAHAVRAALEDGEGQAT